MRFFYLLFSIGFTFSVYAQSFNPFPSGFTAQYTYAGGDSLYILTVDSVSDNQYYFNPTVEMSDIITESPTPVIDSNNIFGQKLVSQSLDSFVFVSKEKDSIFIHPYAPINTEFRFRTDIRAKIVSREKEQILGVADSVITFELSTGHYIKLSENFGFVETYKFDDLGRSGSLPFILSSIPELDMGEYFYDPFNLYDYEIGDVLGYHEYWESYNTLPSYGGEKHWTVEVRDKHVYLDSIVYFLIEKERSYKDYFLSEDIVSVKEKRLVISKGQLLVIPSFSIFKSELVQEGDYLMINKGIGKSILGVYSSLNYGNFIFDRGSFNSIIDYSSVKELSTSLGITIDDYYGYSNSYSYLTCYKNSTGFYGNCLELNSIILSIENNSDLNSAILLTPNPATDFIKLSCEPDAYCKIFNSVGALVMETNFANSIDIQPLEPGFYTLILNSKEKISTHRFLKK